MPIPLTDEFDNSTGEFLNYDAYQVADRTNVRALKHKDIRVMQQADIGVGRTVLALSALDVSALEGLTMTQLEGTQAVQRGEGWTVGTVAPDATRGNERILSVTLSAGTITTASVMPNEPVDLSTGFLPTDHVSIALPAFPAGFVTQASSFVDFTSHPTGDFTVGPTASVALSASVVSLIAGDSEFRVPRSSFVQNGLDLSRITGVRLRIAATGASTLRVAAIRLLPPGWVQGALGIDTRYGRLRKGVSRTGALASGFTWPILWRAATPSGAGDPRPIDGEVSVVFNTGSKANSNQITLYFREVAEDYLTMLDLNGLTMAELNGRTQPDVGTAMYNSKTQTDLDQFNQTQLDGTDQFTLERKPDYTSASWIEFTLTWGSVATQIKMGNTESGNSSFTGNYTFAPPALAANTNYVFFVKLEENEVRATLYDMTSVGGVGNLIFDTTSVIDYGAFRRRAGRFGWYALLGDGDASIDSIRSRKMSYAEYRSLPFESNTPVVGAELFVSASPNVEHYESFAPGPYNAASTTVSKDPNRTTTTESWRVDNLGTDPVQGLQTNAFMLEDFDDTEIAFDVWYPSTTPIQAYLMDTVGRTTQLLMPRITPNQWQRVEMTLPSGQTMLSGYYRLVLLQLSAAASTWWVDGATIFSRSITWEGRAVVDDPWKANDARWVPFKNALNREGGGILFSRRGTSLQVRAKATQQDAHIDRIQFKPKYAQLGLFKPTGVTIPTVPPTASFTTASAGTATVRFTSTSTDSDGFVVNNEWNFGDGTSGVGSVVTHKYPAAGTYTVTLVSMDNNGNRGVFTGSVTA